MFPKRFMLRRLLPLLLVAAGVAGVLAFNTSQREHDYQRLIVEGERALARANLSAALEAFSGAVTLKPDAMLAYLRRGEAYRRRGLADLGPALRDFRAAASLDASAPGPQEGLGDVYAAREDWPRAIDRYRAALALDDRAARVQYKLGLVLYRAGQPDAALRALALAAPLDPKLAEIPYLRGLCLVDTHNPGEAYRAFHDALRLTPGHLLAREELATLCGGIGRTEEEVTHLAALADAQPDRLERLLALGRAYGRTGRLDQAVAVLGRATTRFNHDARIYDAIARVWLEHAVATGDRIALNKGLEAARRASQAGAPPDSALLTQIGNAWLRMRQPRRALRSFEQAAALAPVDPAAYPRLAETAEQLGLWTAARDALRHAHALALDSASGAAARNRMLRLGDLSMKIGDPTEARDWFARARHGASDTTAAQRLAAAEQAIAKERPLFRDTSTR
jgi:tetratricopeptide (TPR) repeat protein